MKKIAFGFLLLLTTLNMAAQCPEGMITSEENLVKNGDFSQGGNHFESAYQLTLEANCGAGHWLPEGYYSVVPNPKMAHCHFSGCRDHTVQTGSMMVVNGATIPDQIVWKQKVSVVPNTTYYFSTWICNALDDAPSKLEFSINGKALGEPIVAPALSCEWKQFFTLWNSEGNTEATISIVNQSTISQGNDFILDDIVFYTCEKPDFKSQLSLAKAGSIIALRNVFFDTGKDELRHDSYEQLAQLIAYLNQKPKSEIEIRGHTDNVGNDDDNQKLSERRAKAVHDYLVSKGINPIRLKYNGFGESNPVDSNETFEGKQKNRRVEFLVNKL
ncbi:MAG TPA: OmpA family protein [Bacteroidia bacterium]|nr:OmpA family protein [Bacteroidia bacterium]